MFKKYDIISFDIYLWEYHDSQATYTSPPKIYSCTFAISPISRYCDPILSPYIGLRILDFICMELYGMHFFCLLSLSIFGDSSMLYESVFHTLLMPSSILCWYTIICFFICLSVDICCQFLAITNKTHICISFFLGKNLEGKWLDHNGRCVSLYKKLPKY